jgi:hypothetical protein
LQFEIGDFSKSTVHDAVYVTTIHESMLPDIKSVHVDMGSMSSTSSSFSSTSSSISAPSILQSTLLSTSTMSSTTIPSSATPTSSLRSPSSSSSSSSSSSASSSSTTFYSQAQEFGSLLSERKSPRSPCRLWFSFCLTGVLFSQKKDEDFPVILLLEVVVTRDTQVLGDRRQLYNPSLLGFLTKEGFRESRVPSQSN